MIRLAVLLLACLAACRGPDTVRSGVGYRDEELAWDGGSGGATDYGGGQAWVEVEWYLAPRPVVMSYDTDTRLFLQGDRPAQAPVAVNVAGDESSSVIGDTVKLAKHARNPDGSFSWEGVVLVVSLAGLGALIWYASRRKR
jgi:hypothetical protein